MELPRVRLIVDAGTPKEREVECFADERLKEYRAVDNPHEVYEEWELDTPMWLILARQRLAT